MFSSSPVLRWRKYSEKYLLQGNQCLACNKVYYPKKHLCACNSTKFQPFTLSGNGTLLTFTRVTLPPAAFTQMAPYCIGIIKLDEGPRILAQMTDVQLSDLKICMKVQAVFRKFYSAGKKEIINYGIKFIPVKSEN